MTTSHSAAARLDKVSGCFAKRVTYSEVDQLGYAHHSATVVWFELARESFFRDLGISLTEYIRDGHLFAMRELNIKYLEFVGYDDPIEIRTAVTRLGRINLDMHYRVDNRRTGKTAVTASSNIVAVEHVAHSGKQPTLGRLLIRDALLNRVIGAEEFLSLPLPPPRDSAKGA